ncbi:hypothetical protein [Novosphingobium sp. Gsoil 351]|uniref:hypothetical protein n=1 Tax=Novosphingobium sp. Gsoil 351 TaxID=2675225 RepID=UPI0012B49347|nr:hypothetical protein [Novosphingobium sp. Gsoil 351]QGN56204.1 hypothetical protein GKE62_18345 [Novosphingobium sp. Gsoil 351]
MPQSPGLGRHSSSQIYSFYAGPTLTTHAGDVALASHRAGYTAGRGTRTRGFRPAPGIPAVDIVDDTLSQIATVSAGFHPATSCRWGHPPRPAGRAKTSRTSISGSTKIRAVDSSFRSLLDVALVAGVGYEDVERFPAATCWR